MVERRDVIELLTEDHAAINRLVEQLDDTDDPAEARALFLRLVERLSAHEAAEQQVLFPTVHRSLPVAAGEAAARASEHEEINELLAEMRSLLPHSLAFAKRASALLLDIGNHFQAEEESLFPRLADVLPLDERVELAVLVETVMVTSPAFPAEPRR
jgi:hemerythrin superfamily protein